MAQSKLSRASKRRVDDLMQRLSDIQLAAHSVDEKSIIELVRRDAIPSRPDGYSTNSMPEHTSGGSFSSRTETVALQETRHRDSELRRMLKHLEKLAMHADVAIHQFLDTLNYAHETDEKIKSPIRTTPCLICEELPAEVSGYCRKDYDNWCNYGRPDRELWKMFQHQTTHKDVDSHDVEVMVPECPPPTTTARRGPWAAK